MHKSSTHIKVITLYCLFAIVMFVAVWLVYDNTKTLIAVNRQNETFVQRRNMADSLVYSLLAVNNAERSLCLGMIKEWDTFDNSLKRASAVAKALKAATTEAHQRGKIDSLITLIGRKRSDMNQILFTMDAAGNDKFYKEKVQSLQAGRDSVVIHPQVKNTSENSETVYEIIKTRRSFFARLADAFKKQRTDTVMTTQRQSQAVADSLSTSIDIADTVADLLTQIKRKEALERLARQQNINSSNRRLQLLSVETATKIEQLFRDISHDEQLSQQEAMKSGNSERRQLIMKIMALAAISVFSALVLIVLVWRDIHRQASYSERLERANAETERLMNQRERLLLTITHDIKAPAASISGFTELLSEHVKDVKGQSFLANIHSSATHLLRLVGALLDYHSLEQGRTEPRSVSFALRPLVESCVSERLPQARTKGLALECSVECGAKTVLRADAFRLKQVLDNLISNAIKYTDEGKVSVSAKLDGQRLILTVADTGRGMDEVEAQQVFNAFTRLHSAQGTEGVGLGLSIVRNVVKLLGGEVSLNSKKGQGTLFTVWIPVEKDMRPSLDAERKETIGTNEGSATIVKTLIVDDDRLQLVLLNEMFGRIEPQVFSVRTATNATEALRIVADEMPDLMLVDVEMPDMDGTEMLKNVDLSRMKAIAMTAHEADIEPRLRAAGFEACLFKPFNTAQLVATLGVVTGLRLQSTPAQAAYSLGVEASSAVKADSANEAAPITLKPDFTNLTAFADGDKTAERQILSDFKTSLAEAKVRLQAAINTSTGIHEARIDRSDISRIAHKLTPTLSMVNSQVSEILPQLTTVKISSFTDTTVADMVNRIINEIDCLMSAINDAIMS